MQEQPGSTTKLEEARRAQQEALDKAIAQRLQVPKNTRPQPNSSQKKPARSSQTKISQFFRTTKPSFQNPSKR